MAVEKKPAAMKTATPPETPAEIAGAAQKFNSAAAKAAKAGSAYEDAAAKLLEKHMPGMLAAAEEYNATRENLIAAIDRNGGIGESKNKSCIVGNVRFGVKKMPGEVIINNVERALQELRRDKNLRQADLKRIIQVKETLSKTGIRNSHLHIKLLARAGIEVRADGDVVFAEVVTPEIKTIVTNLLKKFPAKS